MKPKLLLCIVLVLGGVWCSSFGAQSDGSENSIEHQIEQMAQTNAYFSLTVLVNNRSLRISTSLDSNSRGNPHATAQLRLAKALRSLSGNREALVALLKNPNPKVRTLALGAIFQREAGSDLPLIATLINDSSQTFLNLHEFPGSSFTERLSNFENPQSVGDIARAMLAYWGVRHEGEIDRRNLTTNDFAQYWQKYNGRQYAASWFAVKLKRATRGTTPIQPQYQSDIQRALAEMQTLPMPDRSWTQLYVLASERWFDSAPEDLVTRDSDLIPLVKKIEPASLMRFLQRQPVSSDPDLQMDKDNPEFLRMCRFILRHADLLLRAGDADALLACQYVEHDSGGVSPSWAIGAALVEPARASEILHHALAHETRSFETASGMLAGALWRIRGPAEMDFLVNWFYTHQPNVFLEGVSDSARPDTKQLIAALVKSPRFDYTSWDSLVEILKMVNAGRSTPLVKLQDIYDAQPNGSRETRMIYPVWRNLLRREYGMPEKPLPSPAARPKHVLANPSWSARLSEPPSDIALSPDGKWLAAISDGNVAIWQADTGKQEWKIPSKSVAGAYSIAFQRDGARLTVFHKQSQFKPQFSEWDLATRQSMGQVTPTLPQAVLSRGAYCFDGAALRAAIAGYTYLACLDTKSSMPLWVHTGEGGVSVLIALSADGTRLAASKLNLVKLYDAGTGTIVRQFDQFASLVLALELSSDARKLATITTAAGLQLWDTATGELLKEYAYHVEDGDKRGPVFSPDGQWLAVTGAEAENGRSRVGVFSVDSGELAWEIQYPSRFSDNQKVPMAFSADGKVLYTGMELLEEWSLK